MDPADESRSELVAEINKTVATATESAAKLVQSVALYSYLLATLMLVTGFFAKDIPAVLQLIIYLGVPGCVILGIWMHYTVIRLLKYQVAWYWWAWASTLLTASATHTLSTT